MHFLSALFGSSLGKKYIMAVTGLVLLGFVLGHLLGNFQFFGHPDLINGYAHVLQGMGPFLWLLRIGLLTCVGLHLWAAVALVQQNRAASAGRSEKYAVVHTNRASVASRYMIWSGLVVMAFIVYHVLHFTVGVPGDRAFKTELPPYTMQAPYVVLGVEIVAAGAKVKDVHTMMVAGFTSPLVSGFYILSIGLLSWHLLHGTASIFQSLGLKTSKWDGWLQPVVAAGCLLFFLGNLLLPGAVLAGAIKLHPAARAHLSAPSAPGSLPAAR